VQAAGRLLTGGSVDPEQLGEGGLRFMLRETGMPEVGALAETMSRVSDAAAEIFTRLLEARRGRGMQPTPRR
jgi:glutamate-ammonia-ligase adenylyltransferase